MALLPDVRELLTDPDLGGGVSFIVYRTTHKRSYGHVEEAQTTTYTAAGNLQPAGSVDLQSMADEDRKNEFLVIRSTFDFQTGQDNGETFTAADEVAALGRMWRVTRVEPWSPWGFCVAYAALKTEGGE